MRTRGEALDWLVRAWEELPGGTVVDNKAVERWLFDSMKPAIDNARETIGTLKPLTRPQYILLREIYEAGERGTSGSGLSGHMIVVLLRRGYIEEVPDTGVDYRVSRQGRAHLDFVDRMLTDDPNSRF